MNRKESAQNIDWALIRLNNLEARGGFEPPHKGFADLSLNHLGTAPFPKPLGREAISEPLAAKISGAGDGI